MKTRPKVGRPRLPSVDTLSGLVQLFSVLGDASRLKIILALARDGEIGFTALLELLGKSQPLLSYNLAKLGQAGLTRCRSEGKKTFYRLEWDKFREVLERFFAEEGDEEQTLHLGDFSLVYRPGPGR